MVSKRLASVLCLLIMGAAIAQADSVPGTIVKCISGCSSPSPNANSAPRPAPPVYTPSPEELRQQQLRAEAYALDLKGNQAYARKDWSVAADYYRMALEKTPGDTVIRQNLANAQSWLGVEAYNKQDWKTAFDTFQEAVKNNPSNTIFSQWLKASQEKYQAAEWAEELKRQNAATAQQMRGTLGQLSATVASAPTVSTPGLSFGNTSPAGNEMADAPNNGKNGDGSQAGAIPGLTFGGSTDAGRQLKSAVKHSEAAVSDGISVGPNSDNLIKPFDSPGDQNGSLDTMVVDARLRSQPSAPQVPAAVRNSPAYKQLQARTEELEKNSAKLDTKLEEIRQQQASGQGDQSALAVAAAEIKNEQTALRSEKATLQIKMDDLSVSFQEAKSGSGAPSAPQSSPPPPPQ